MEEPTGQRESHGEIAIMDGCDPKWATKAEVFHDRNPQVWDTIVELALKMKRSGRNKYAIKVLFNVMRWHHDLNTVDDTQYKLNDGYRAWYSRKIMQDVPELDGFFKLRRRDYGEELNEES